MTHKPLFAERFNNLKDLTEQPSGYLRFLIEKNEEKTRKRNPGNRRSQHQIPTIFLHLHNDTPESLQKAKQLFLEEWNADHSNPKNFHYWNSEKFLHCDRWMCATIMSQLLIFFDWLACKGVFTEKEINTIAEEAVNVMHRNVEPHLLGRGEYPLLHEPINQNIAMLCGMLYAGFLFGYKWKKNTYAQRLYTHAKSVYQDTIGQFPSSGYDGDGMTYMREITLSCMTLCTAILEEADGSDWYFRRFAPNNVSLADLNKKQFGFVHYGGWSMPAGRYGYIRNWCTFQLSYAGLKTGDPRYLQAAKRDCTEDYSYETPWTSAEIPLALLWYPKELNEAISNQELPIEPETGCIPDSWAAFADKKSAMNLRAMWLPGKAPNYFMDAYGSPLIISGVEQWSTSNCVQPGTESWGFESWHTPPGTLQFYSHLPNLQAACVETTASYPPAAEVEFALRTFFKLSTDTFLISDRYSSKKTEGILQLAVAVNPEIDNSNVLIKGSNGSTLNLSAAEGSFNNHDEKQNSRRMKPESSVIHCHNKNGHFDILHCASPKNIKRKSAIQPIRNDLVHVEYDETRQDILLYGSGEQRTIGSLQTDAAAAVTDGEVTNLLNVRRAENNQKARIHTNTPVDICFKPEKIIIDKLGYGDFAWLWLCGGFAGIRCGNTLSISARFNKDIEFHIKGNFNTLLVNGVEQTFLRENNRLIFTIHEKKTNQTIADKLQTASQSSAAGTIIDTIKDAATSMSFECIPILRKLLSWDAAPKAGLRFPNMTEATNVRGRAAYTLMLLGAAEAIPDLEALIEMEFQYPYTDNETKNKPHWKSSKEWDRQFHGSTARVAALDALTKLDGKSAADTIKKILKNDIIPHSQEAALKALKILT